MNRGKVLYFYAFGEYLLAKVSPSRSKSFSTIIKISLLSSWYHIDANFNKWGGGGGGEGSVV